jgi:catechol 2,3-dioxygenase-like lactoylglutathione lyase family enzyme
MHARILGVLLTIVAVFATAAHGEAVYDHVHMAATDPAKTATWYVDHLGGRPYDRPDRIIFGKITFSFLKADAPKPSSGSVVDHLGFSFADVDSKMTELVAAGAKIVTPARDVEGLFKLGFVEDPWGTRLEILQDPELLGFHHIHLRLADPDAALKWYGETFGGERSKLKGRIDGVRYRDQDVWLLAAKAEGTVPSEGHTIDHISWRFADLNSAIATMKAKNIKVTMEPRVISRPTEELHASMIEDPSGVKIECVQRIPK